MHTYELTTGISKINGKLVVLITVVDGNGNKRECAVTSGYIEPITSKDVLLDYEPNDICTNYVTLDFDIFKMSDEELGLYLYWLAAYKFQQTIHIPNSPRRLDERGVYTWCNHFEIMYYMRLDKNNRPVFNK